MLKKLFGGKNSFYLQLDEKESAKSAPEAASTAPVETATADSPEEKSAAPSQKTSIKSKKASQKASAPAPAEPVAVAPAPAPKASLDPKLVAFASGEPVPQNISRRTPGPSLNGFKAMARQLQRR